MFFFKLILKRLRRFFKRFQRKMLKNVKSQKKFCINFIKMHDRYDTI